MHPVLFEFSMGSANFTVQAYTFFTVFLTGAVSLIILTILLRVNGVSRLQSLGAGLVVVLVVLVGARLSYALVNFQQFANEPGEIFQLHAGNFNMWGGLVLGLPLIALVPQFLKLRTWRFLDLLAPVIGMAAFASKIGCYLNGCCFGAPTSLPWGVTFPAGTRAAQHFSEHLEAGGGEIITSLPYLHPVQLYESFAGLFVLVMAVLMLRQRLQEGTVFLLSMVFISVSRLFAVPVTTGDYLSILLYVVVALGALFLLCWRRGAILRLRFYNKKVRKGGAVIENINEG